MALLVPNSGEATMLEMILNKTPAENLVLRLFVNDKVPAESDNALDYTEASGNGYGSVNLSAASWTVTQGSSTFAAYPEVDFVFTGPLGNVYGYYLTQISSGKLIWAERFSNGPYNIVNSGDMIMLTPKIELE